MSEVAAAAIKSATRDGIPMPRIGAPLADGVFAGIVRGEDADYALVLLPAPKTNITWKAAMEWAASCGAALPTRREQSILFGNLRDKFPDGGWYWSCEQYAGHEGYAWFPVLRQRRPGRHPQGQRAPGPSRPQVAFSHLAL